MPRTHFSSFFAALTRRSLTQFDNGLQSFCAALTNNSCTRLTNAHSKKAENHVHAMALFIAFYNHCRVHSTLKTSPVVVAGVADHVWTLEELIGLAY